MSESSLSPGEARHLWCEKMSHVSRSSLTIEQVLTVLDDTPPRIEALTAGLEPAQLRAAPDPDEWSANDVLAHLRACADVWGDCIVTITAEDRPTLRAVNPRSWIEKADYPDQEFRPSLQAFATQRTDLMAVLRSLPPAGWSRSATVTGAGKALERTVLFYAQWLARHERPHIKQIERVVAAMRQFRDTTRADA
jgi:DinB superfamily